MKNNENKRQLSTPELRIIGGNKLIKHCQLINDRSGFNIGIEAVSTGIREQIQRGKSLQSIGEIFTNEQL